MHPELEQDVFEAERSSSNTKWISAPVKRQNETRNRSRDLPNAFPPRETDQNFRKTPSRGGKWGKFSEKRLPAAGNGKNSQKNGFPRREMGKILRKTVSCGGKAVKFAGDRFPAAGNGAKSPKSAFRRAKSIFKKPPSPPREGTGLRFLIYSFAGYNVDSVSCNGSFSSFLKGDCGDKSNRRCEM